MQNNQHILVQNIFAALPELRQFHNVDNPLFNLLHREIESFYVNRESEKILIEPFADVIFPQVSLGNLNSNAYLHAREEFVVRSFYARNANRYKTFFDVGSNIGWDALLAASLGWQVDAFEPDPDNFDQLQQNIKRNQFSNIRAHCKALSSTSGELNFVRVKGNTAASHVAGSRGYYGDTEAFSVSATCFEEIGFFPDLIKMNIEAFEKNVIGSIPFPQWQKTDCIVAMHDEDNRNAIYEHFVGSDVHLFSQKIGWEKAMQPDDLSLEKEGYVFITSKEVMPW